MGDWLNHWRLLVSVGNIPPAEAESSYCAAQQNLFLPACLNANSLGEMGCGGGGLLLHLDRA